jgi:tRNA1(Val) A37 N6-methylase TrmN6
VEFGAGVGAAGLALAYRVPDVSVTLVELDPALASLAQQNAERNGLADRVTVTQGDVAHLAALPRSVSGVMMNPPFNEARSGTISPDLSRAQAHTGGAALLRSWMQAAARLLPAGGRVTLIWRAEKAADVTAALEQEFGAVRVLPVHTRHGQSPTRILVQAIRGGAAGTVTLPAIHLANADGTPSALANAVLRHGAALSFLPAAE